MKNFKRVEDELPIGLGEVFGYNEKWIDEDYNTDGICVCYLQDGEPNYWVIAKWCGYHDEWHTRESHEAQENLGDAREDMPYIDPPTHWIEKYKICDLKNALDKLFVECEHGDEDHRKWLKNKFENFYNRYK